MESGNLAYGFGTPPSTFQLESVADMLAKMGYAVVGIGALDSKFGDAYYEVMKARGIPVVHADITLPDGGTPYVIRKVGGIKVGIVSFGYVDPYRRDDLTLWKRQYEAFVQARRKSDILILLDQANTYTTDWVRQNGYRFGAPDIVMSGGARVSMPTPETIGGAMVLPTSSQGTYIDRVDVTYESGKPIFRFDRTLIDEAIRDDPEVALMAKNYENNQTITVSENRSTSGGYRSHTTCKNCHEDEYEQWKSTPHAMALKTLVDEKRTTQDCLPCHSEMYRRTKQIVLTKDLLGGVECQSCHANVVPHPAGFKARGDTAAIRATCASCHTKDRSPDFQPNWFEKVKHNRG